MVVFHSYVSLPEGNLNYSYYSVPSGILRFSSLIICVFEDDDFP